MPAKTALSRLHIAIAYHGYHRSIPRGPHRAMTYTHTAAQIHIAAMPIIVITFPPPSRTLRRVVHVCPAGGQQHCAFNHVPQFYLHVLRQSLHFLRLTFYQPPRLLSLSESFLSELSEFILVYNLTFVKCFFAFRVDFLNLMCYSSVEGR